MCVRYMFMDVSEIKGLAHKALCAHMVPSTKIVYGNNCVSICVCMLIHQTEKQPSLVCDLKYVASPTGAGNASVMTSTMSGSRDRAAADHRGCMYNRNR